MISQFVVHEVGFRFEHAGRRYWVPFGVVLRKRNPLAREGQSIASALVQASTGRPCVTWSGPPAVISSVESLVKDYELDDFLVEGEGMGEREPRGPRAHKVEPNTSEPVAIEKVETVLGWPITYAQGEPEPLIEDEELGRRLGYETPRKVRELIGRLFNDSGVRRTVRQTPGGGRPAKVCLLTERQTVIVCLSAETEQARKIRDEVVDVFLAVRHGRVPAPAPESPEQVALRLLGWTAKEHEKQIAESREMASKATEDAARAKEEVAKVAERQSALEAELEGVKERVATPALRLVSPPRPAPGLALTHEGQRIYSLPVPESMSGAALSERLGLPSSGPGKQTVGILARAFGVLKDPTCYVPDQKFRHDGFRYLPKALDILRGPAERFKESLLEDGYVVVNGRIVDEVPQARARRSIKASVEVAVAFACSRSKRSPQGNLPGVA